MNKVIEAVDRLEARSALSEGAAVDAAFLRETLENTYAVYWYMLKEMEGSLGDWQAQKKLDIEAGYRHWNLVHGSKPCPPAYRTCGKGEESRAEGRITTDDHPRPTRESCCISRSCSPYRGGRHRASPPPSLMLALTSAADSGGDNGVA